MIRFQITLTSNPIGYWRSLPRLAPQLEIFAPDPSQDQAPQFNEHVHIKLLVDLHQFQFVDQLTDLIVQEFQKQHFLFLNNKQEYVLVNSDGMARVDDLKTLRPDDNLLILHHNIYRSEVVKLRGVSWMQEILKKQFAQSNQGEQGEKLKQQQQEVIEAHIKLIELKKNREKALKDYIQMQREKQRVKIDSELETRKHKELLNDFDCVPTPQIDDFDIRNKNKQELISSVKRIAILKKFKVVLQNGPNKIIHFVCSHSPYFDHKYCCPFKLRYREENDTGEYFLTDYDEMHNHILKESHQIMPYPIKYNARPKFLTPNFDDFKEIGCDSNLHMKQTVYRMAFDRGFGVIQTLVNETKKGFTTTFTCKYKFQTTSHNDDNIQAIEKNAHTFRCPFKLKYILYESIRSNQPDNPNGKGLYVLEKFEDRHMHPVGCPNGLSIPQI